MLSDVTTEQVLQTSKSDTGHQTEIPQEAATAAMPGMMDVSALDNRLAALEARVEVIESEVHRVLTELVAYLKEKAFRDISSHVTI